MPNIIVILAIHNLTRCFLCIRACAMRHSQIRIFRTVESPMSIYLWQKTTFLFEKWKKLWFSGDQKNPGPLGNWVTKKTDLLATKTRKWVGSHIECAVSVLELFYLGRRTFSTKSLFFKKVIFPTKSYFQKSHISDFADFWKNCSQNWAKFKN